LFLAVLVFSASSILKASFVTKPCLRPQSRKDGFFIKPANFVCGIAYVVYRMSGGEAKAGISQLTD